MTAFMAREISNLGKRVKSLRELAGLTQAQLAEKSGVQIDVIRKLEQGGAYDPRWSTVCGLADGLGITLDMLRGPAEKKA